MTQLTQARLKEVLSYDRESGFFVRILLTSANCNVLIGSVAGYDNGNSYLRINIDGKKYYLHRLAFLYENGYFPEGEIDHINQDSLDNRFCNLREVSRQCNLRNVSNQKNNTSGVKGVSFDKNNKKWLAQITINYANKNLGYHSDLTEAVATRLAAEQAENWSGCDSSSPAFQYMEKYLSQVNSL